LTSTETSWEGFGPKSSQLLRLLAEIEVARRRNDLDAIGRVLDRIPANLTTPDLDAWNEFLEQLGASSDRPGFW